MDFREALYTALRVKYLGDTGGGGLNETSGTAAIASMWFADNFENIDANARQWPYVVVRIDQEDRHTDGGTTARGVVTLEVHDQVDYQSQPTVSATAPLTRIGRVCSRIRVLYDNATLATQGTTPNSWRFATIDHARGPTTLPSTASEIIRTHTLVVWARRV